MKIEMGESLIYSWLTHEKSCQIVDSNWKTSKAWTLMNATEIEKVIEATYELFTTSNKGMPKLGTFLKCAECDLLGVNFHNAIEGKYTLHAVDIAFHENGLGYNEYDPDAKKQKNVSAARAIKKSLRTALCLYGYLNVKKGYIYFVSPKISPSVYKDLIARTAKLQAIMDSLGFEFKFIVYANKDFTEKILNPIISISEDVKNDNELWLRAYQLLNVAQKAVGIKLNDVTLNHNASPVAKKSKKTSAPVTTGTVSIASYAKQIIDYINAGKVTQSEIDDFQDHAMSKQLFDLNYPLLVNVKNIYPTERYYSKSNLIVKFNNEEYVFCSQWFARQKQHLDDWFAKH